MIIAIDIGGTKTLLAVFDTSMNIVKSIKFKTPKADYVAFLDEVRNASIELPLEDIQAGAIGTRGVIDKEKGELVLDDKLGWSNIPLVKDFKEIFSCDFSIENDAKMAGLSESRADTARGYSKVLYVTVSTGTNCAFAVDGKLDQNTIGAEVGKWLVEKDGKIQLWEEVISGTWIKEQYGKLASEIDDPDAWKEITNRLALGFINLSAAYTPDLIVVGGGVGHNFDKFGDMLQSRMKEIAHPMVSIPPVIEASYPEDAVIYGCYYNAHDRLTAQ